MKILVVALAASAGLGLGLGLGPAIEDGTALAGASPAASATAQEHPGRIAVKLAPGTRFAATAAGALTVVRDWASLEAAKDANGLPLEVVGLIDGLGISVLEAHAAAAAPAESPADLDAAARALRLLPGVLWAEVGQPLRACLVPNDPFYAPSGRVGQWGVERVGLSQAWDTTSGSASVIVAVLDTGINPNIPDFSGRIVSPYCALTESSEWPVWRDDSDGGHGTAVAGVAVAQGNNGQGIAGAAWNVKIMPVKISEDTGSDTITLAMAIRYAVDKGADVINISFATLPGSSAGQTLKDAVAYAIGRGVTIVAAAGNSGSSSVAYPAGISGVVAVGATDSSDSRWTADDESSNMGSALDLVAPGRQILTFADASDDLFGYYQGTSLSSPLVAGVVALMLSVDASLTPEEVLDILAESADDLGTSGWDKEFGWGILDAAEALVLAGGGSPTTTTTTVPSTTTSTLPVTTTTTLATPGFDDVSEDTTPYWYEIGYLASLGIVAGSTDGSFYPEDPVKRQQFAKMIVLSAGYVVSLADTCPFVDVERIPGQLYPYHYVAVAYQCGFTQGTSATHYSPYRTLSRAQLITMVARAAQLTQPPADYAPPFGNFSATHYPYARQAAYAGLLEGLVGMGPDYDFLAPATRGEVCMILYSLRVQ